MKKFSFTGRPNFPIFPFLTNIYNFDHFLQLTNFPILTKFLNFDQILQFRPNFAISAYQYIKYLEYLEYLELGQIGMFLSISVSMPSSGAKLNSRDDPKGERKMQKRVHLPWEDVWASWQQWLIAFPAALRHACLWCSNVHMPHPNMPGTCICLIPTRQRHGVEERGGCSLSLTRRLVLVGGIYTLYTLHHQR